jgi:hypothetical protein
MSGQVLLFDLEKETVVEERRDHKKYVVKVSTSEDEKVFGLQQQAGTRRFSYIVFNSCPKTKVLLGHQSPVSQHPLTLRPFCSFGIRILWNQCL